MYYVYWIPSPKIKCTRMLNIFTVDITYDMFRLLTFEVDFHKINKIMLIKNIHSSLSSKMRWLIRSYTSGIKLQTKVCA